MFSLCNFLCFLTKQKHIFVVCLDKENTFPLCNYPCATKTCFCYAIRGKNTQRKCTFVVHFFHPNCTMEARFYYVIFKGTVLKYGQKAPSRLVPLEKVGGAYSSSLILDMHFFYQKGPNSPSNSRSFCQCRNVNKHTNKHVLD